MTTLRYRSFVQIEDLALGECTIHRASSALAARWWQLWIHAPRDIDGEPDYFCVPVNPNGSFCQGPGGKTWGLSRNAIGRWQISPSIDVKQGGDAYGPAESSAPSLWHQTPEIVDVPDGERWIVAAP